MPISINFEQITPLLDEKTLILTPNSRTQKALITGFIQPFEQGDVIRAPQIISYSQWLEQLWEELSFYQALPNIIGDLELKLWLKELILKEEHWQLTNALGVAEKVLEAYRNLKLWNKKLTDIESLDTPENQYFIQWASELEKFCEQQNLLPQFSVINFLNNQLFELKTNLIKNRFPEKILLVGFNQFSPIEELFLNYCDELGVEVIPVESKKLENIVNRIEAADFRQELEIAAAQSQKFVKENPEKTIGVVVQQLSSHLTLIHQVFSHYFQPNELLPWQALEKTQYNVSAGEPLVNMAMIDSAVQLLKLQSSGFDLQTLSFLKNSPFIFWGEYQGVIKRFIHEQSLLSYSKYSLNYLTTAIEKEPKSEQLELLTRRLNELKNREQYSRPISAWIDNWNFILKNWGWLENKKLDEAEIKLQTEFYSALKDCLKISLIYPRLTNQQAKDYFFQLLGQKVFQTASDRTNIQVLGVLEAAGLEFDEIIMVGFNRDNWPQKHKTNPFLSIIFQQDNNMPGSSAEREYLYAKNISDSLLTSSANIIITQSHPDEKEAIESALFSGYPLIKCDLEKLLLNQPIIKPDYQWIKDEKINVDTGKIKGGAYLLSQYATCPFKAMSSFQLKLKAAQQPTKGIEPKTKGAWLHLAMELLWQDLKTQSVLLTLSEQKITELVELVVLKAKQQFLSQLMASAALEVIDIESEKLQQQIMEWLILDKQREPFEVTTEVEKQLSLSSLEFKFRVDRIDQNANGGIEIIDYKSGNVDVKKWLGKRPEEAQMPAYVLSCEAENIHSLSYAKIKTGEICRTGIWFEKKDNNQYQFIEQTPDKKQDKSKSILANKNLIDPEQTLAAQWRINLTELTDKILAGDMPVSPKFQIESCRYCDFADFCRIAEAQPEKNNHTEPKNNLITEQEELF